MDTNALLLKQNVNLTTESLSKESYTTQYALLQESILNIQEKES